MVLLHHTFEDVSHDLPLINCEQLSGGRARKMFDKNGIVSANIRHGTQFQAWSTNLQTNAPNGFFGSLEPFTFPFLFLLGGFSFPLPFPLPASPFEAGSAAAALGSAGGFPSGSSALTPGFSCPSVLSVFSATAMFKRPYLKGISGSSTNS